MDKNRQLAKVKICGVRTVEQALWAADAGATWAGVVLAPSRRQVSGDTAAEIVQALAHTPTRIVGVFANAPVDEIRAAVQTIGLAIAQLSGLETPADVAALSSGGIVVWKAIHVPATATENDMQALLERMDTYRTAGAAAILLDAATASQPIAGGSGSVWGGNGQAFDWTIAAHLVREHRGQVILAGGLTPESVGMAVDAVQPWAVDVSSGVETNGQKDRHKISQFIQQARQDIRSQSAIAG